MSYIVKFVIMPDLDKKKKEKKKLFDIRFET